MNFLWKRFGGENRNVSPAPIPTVFFLKKSHLYKEYYPSRDKPVNHGWTLFVPNGAQAIVIHLKAAGNHGDDRRKKSRALRQETRAIGSKAIGRRCGVHETT